jgi:exonuclease I
MVTRRNPQHKPDIIEKLHNELLRSGITGKNRESRKWLIGKAQALASGHASLNRQSIIKNADRVRGFLPGRMYCYVYDAKWKKKLPYWDMFPLVIPIEYYNNGFLGCNWHYLDVGTRALLLSRLHEFKNNRRYDDTTAFSLSYMMLKETAKLEIMKPTIHRYLYSHIRSQIMEIKSTEWEIAVFLPCEHWRSEKYGY